MNDDEKLEVVDALLALVGGWSQLSQLLTREQDRQNVLRVINEGRTDWQRYWRIAFYDAVIAPSEADPNRPILTHCVKGGA